MSKKGANMTIYEKLMQEVNKVRERNRREYEALADLTGKTVAEVEADLTAPDPGREMCHTYCPLCDRDTAHDALGDGWVCCRACGCKQTVRKEAEHVPSM